MSQKVKNVAFKDVKFIIIMTPARRKRKDYKFVRILIIASVVVVVMLFFKFGSRFWTGKDKLSLVVGGEDQDVRVVVFDPRLREVTTLIIPEETEVEVSRSLGNFRIKNVWKLGLNEKIGGRLLAETVTKNFLFPVFLWSESSPGNLRFVFSPGETNIPISDRIQLFTFSLRVGSQGKSEIDLGKSQFLRRVKLIDGEEGYKLIGKISERLTVYFAQVDTQGEDLKIFIKDASGSSGKAERVGEILEVMGGKVVSISRLPLDESDCEVTGLKKDFVKKVSLLFSCKEVKAGDADLEIMIGKGFARRF